MREILYINIGDLFIRRKLNLGTFDSIYYGSPFMAPVNFGSSMNYGLNSTFMCSAFSPQLGIMGNYGDMDFMSMFLQQSLMANTFSKMQTGYGMYVVDHKKLESQYSPVIEKYAKQYGVDPDVAKSIARQESAFNPYAVSKAGAKGMFQLMDGTARDMGVQNVFDPEQNIKGGIKYLAYLLKRYNGDYRKAVAAYNGGMANVDKYGIDFCAETSNYHRKVLGSPGLKNSLA